MTLGALSTRNGQKLAGLKRHPTIGNHVTIYSNSTVLGGDTVIGEHCIIGGNTFITESVPPYTKVSAKSPELIFKTQKKIRKRRISGSGKIKTPLPWKTEVVKYRQKNNRRESLWDRN